MLLQKERGRPISCGLPRNSIQDRTSQGDADGAEIYTVRSRRRRGNDLLSDEVGAVGMHNATQRDGEVERGR
jgi:hypothetical protein